MKKIAEIKKILTDYIFPVFCLGCNIEGVWICESCNNKISKVESSQFFEEKQNGFKALFSALVYEDTSLLENVFKVFKYEFSHEAFDFFAPITEEYFAERKQYFENIDIIIPIPLHPRRYAERGFNQSEMIADIIASILGKSVAKDAVRRIRYTKKQAHLSKEEREENIKGAFRLSEDYDFSGKNILLVDDVFTTGATMCECAKLFKKKNTNGIFAFTLFRGR